MGHRSVYASQKLGFVKSMALSVPLGGAIGDVERRHLTVKPGSQFARLARRRRFKK